MSEKEKRGELNIVEFKDNKYIVIKIKFTSKDKKIDKYLFGIIDYDQKEKLLKYNEWHTINNHTYIGTTYYDEKKIELYLHNVIMDVTPKGKGSYITVDHINRIGLDNRKVNLRLLNQSEQNFNQSNRSKIHSEFPKYIVYLPEENTKNGKNEHGERYEVDLRGLPKDI